MAQDAQCSAALDNPFHHFDQLSLTDGLLQVFGASFVRAPFDCRVALPGDQDHRNAQIPSRRRGEKVEAGGARQVLVEDQTAVWRPLIMADEVARRPEILDIKPKDFYQ